MKYLKLLIIPLMALCFNVAFAGPPECYKGRALFESREAFFERVEKYHAQDLVNNRKKVKAKFGECSDRLVILDYIFFGSQNRDSLEKYTPYIYDGERQEVITLLNIITDDKQKSEQMFDKFYQKYLEDYAKEKQTCLDECVLRSVTHIDGFYVTAIGAVYARDDLKARRVSHIRLIGMGRSNRHPNPSE